MVHALLVGCSIYHYCLMFDIGVAHIVVLLSTITVLGLREERFMLFWLPILSTITL